MAKQKITLSIDQNVLQRARIDATQHSLSVSAYLVQVLDQASLRVKEYETGKSESPRPTE